MRALLGPHLADRAPGIEAIYRRPAAYLEWPALGQLPHPVPGTARAQVWADRRSLDAIIDAEVARLRRHPSDDPVDVWPPSSPTVP